MANLKDIKISGDDTPCTGLNPDALPAVPSPVLAENLPIGVSTKNIPLPKHLQEARSAARMPHWYALRTTYGREKKAYDYLSGKGVEVFYPTVKSVKEVEGKRKTIEESRLPNIFFARGTEKQIKAFVYDNANLPYLRFYYRHFHEGALVVKAPLVVPDNQMETLKIICASEEDIIILPNRVQKFEKGQTVRVTGGIFKGAIGKVARFQGQQRVGIVIDGQITVASAYIPSAFLEQT